MGQEALSCAAPKVRSRICSKANSFIIKTAQQFIIFQQNIHLDESNLILQSQKSMQSILDYEFDLSNPVYMLHPNNKFWETTLTASTVTFRVGKLKDNTQIGEQKIQKTYSSAFAAKTSVIQKITEKLTKGYVGRDAVLKGKVEEKQIKQNKPSKRGGPSYNKFKTCPGEYYQSKDGKSNVKLQINGSKVRITKNMVGEQEQVQIRSTQSPEDAVLYCIQQEQSLKRQGFQPQSHKFLYSFIDEDLEQRQKPQPKRGGHNLQIKKQNQTKSKSGSSGRNVLSITNMTDDAMSHRSRDNSSAKSDRSYDSDHGDNSYAQTKTKLGPPTSSCIKVLLAETYKDALDPTGWIMSEKLDGVRCFWTGSSMYSRNGNHFYFPKFFTRNWPNSQLDGELFIGRGRFSETLSAIKKNSPIEDQWKKVKYLVFDCPGLKKPFKDRIKAMQQVISEIDNPYIKCHAHRECTGFPDLFQELDQVNKIEGQGLMLRDPQSFYENRRSKSLLKVKTFHDDQAVVLGYTAGTGRCQGMVGALKVRNSHGVEFEIGSGLTDKERRRPPKIGSKVTYKYQEFNKDSGKPRFPTYMRAYEQI